MDLSELSIVELAAFICDSLKKEGLQATLSGGACAEIYSNNAYVTGDLDFVVNFIWPENDKIIQRVMSTLGFIKTGRIYINKTVAYSVEFPPGPLCIGEEYMIKPVEMKNINEWAKHEGQTDKFKDFKMILKNNSLKKSRARAKTKDITNKFF
jgi:hypothetical protein